MSRRGFGRSLKAKIVAPGYLDRDTVSPRSTGASSAPEIISLSSLVATRSVSVRQ